MPSAEPALQATRPGLSPGLAPVTFRRMMAAAPMYAPWRFAGLSGAALSPGLTERSAALRSPRRTGRAPRVRQDRAHACLPLTLASGPARAGARRQRSPACGDAPPPETEPGGTRDRIPEATEEATGVPCLYCQSLLVRFRWHGSQGHVPSLSNAPPQNGGEGDTSATPPHYKNLPFSF